MHGVGKQLMNSGFVEEDFGFYFQLRDQTLATSITEILDQTFSVDRSTRAAWGFAAAAVEPDRQKMYGLDHVLAVAKLAAKNVKLPAVLVLATFTRTTGRKLFHGESVPKIMVMDE